MTPRQERGRSPTGGGARTATALPNRVSRRRQGRWAEQESQGAAPPLMPTLGTRDIAAALNRAGALGHRVTACGTRPASATTARRPQTTEVVARWPHRYVAATEIDVHTRTPPEHGRRTSPLTRSRRRAGSPPSTPGRRPSRPGPKRRGHRPHRRRRPPPKRRARTASGKVASSNGSTCPTWRVRRPQSRSRCPETIIEEGRHDPSSTPTLQRSCWSDRFFTRSAWWGGWDSNPRPTDYESAALTG